MAAISNAGALGTLGLSTTPHAHIGPEIAAIRAAMSMPSGVNHLACFMAEEALVASEVVQRIMAEAEDLLVHRLPALVSKG